MKNENTKTFLKTSLVNEKLEGVKRGFIYKRMRLNNVTGRHLLDHGILPRDKEQARFALSALSELTGLSVNEMLETLVALKVPA